MEKSQMIKNNLNELRRHMKTAGVTYYLMTTSDYHASEYIGGHYKETEFFSGFTGSNAQLLVGMDGAWLWTDGRYFEQAAGDMAGTGIELMKMDYPGVPSLEKFLSETLKETDCLSFDSRLISAGMGEKLAKAAEEANADLGDLKNLTYKVWKQDRPADSAEGIFILDEGLAGQLAGEKIAAVFDFLRREKAGAFFLSKLDDQMWLFNIRGRDIAYNPVAYAFTLFAQDKVYLFLKAQAISPEIKEYFASLGAELADYDSALSENFTKRYSFGEEDVLYDKKYTSYYFQQALSQMTKGKTRPVPNPTESWKAVKNSIEIENMKKTYLLDSLAVVRFLKYMKTTKEPLTERKCAAVLDGMRREIEGFLDLSFPTISAYGAHAAMMHYDQNEREDTKVGPGGILLVDSGGQYLGGTTDVTRSIVLGELSDEVKRQYTKVCAGMLRLMNAKFMKGCTGQNLDILARGPLWELGIDYKCGTGHGIGYILNVHEGPQRIGWQIREGQRPVPLEQGMVVSDEPGVYVEGSHGIRLETILLCVPFAETGDGEFLGFEPLTFVPIDLGGIEPSELSDEEIKMLDDYHELVFRKLSPYLTEEEKDWLEQETRKLGQ